MTVGAAVTGNQNKITVLAVFVDFGIPSAQKVPQTSVLNVSNGLAEHIEAQPRKA